MGERWYLARLARFTSTVWEAILGQRVAQAAVTEVAEAWEEGGKGGEGGGGGGVREVRGEGRGEKGGRRKGEDEWKIE